jgi:hypothetical protein
MTLTFGMLCFGILIGFVTYRTLIRTTDKSSINDLTIVVGAIGGGAITAIVHPVTDAFAWYAIGLLGGFTIYGLSYWRAHGSARFAEVMGGRTGAPEPVPGQGAPRKQP